MMKKYIILIFLFQFLLISCSKVEVISDPYWNTLIADFDGKAVGLRLQALLNGKRLNLIIADISEGLPDISNFTESMSDVYLLSPLLSQVISSSGIIKGSGIFYYFGSTNRSVVEDSSDNMVIIERDRRKAFFDAGILAAEEVLDESILSIVYDEDNSVQKKEAESFLDGIKKSDKNISIVSLKIKSSTSESEIRSFFDMENVNNNSYVAIFTDKWKNICYELSERDGKLIITSDSWFYKTYESFIVFSIEDDIKGMIKKVYNNIKTGKHTNITLDGLINR
jgi:hypothetical protein